MKQLINTILFLILVLFIIPLLGIFINNPIKQAIYVVVSYGIGCGLTMWWISKEYWLPKNKRLNKK